MTGMRVSSLLLGLVGEMVYFMQAISDNTKNESVDRRPCAGAALLLKLFPLFLLLISFFLSSAVFASESVRVLIMDKRKTVTLRSTTGLIAEGAHAGSNKKKITFGASSLGRTPVRVRASGGGFVRVNGKQYRGWIEIRKRRNRTLRVINELDIEEYLMGVVAAEIPHRWEYEALKSQAVASRTYALYIKENTGRKSYHLVATVNNQLYGGGLGERERTVRAVRETRGLVIAYDGGIIPAFYHSSCGGHTENASELWGIDVPYLKGVDCDCQEISKYGLWEKRFSIARISRALNRKGYGITNMRSLKIESITPAGRVRDVAITHSGGVLSLPAETLRAAIGYSRIPSVFFEPAVRGKEVVLSGRGFGHGVGLCQWGAREMAQKGKDFRSILSRYYPGTKVVPMDELR